MHLGLLFKGSKVGRDWDLSCVFAKTAALFAIYLMPCLFFVARINWMNSGSVAKRVIYLAS